MALGRERLARRARRAAQALSTRRAALAGLAALALAWTVGSFCARGPRAADPELAAPAGAAASGLALPGAPSAGLSAPAADLPAGVSELSAREADVLAAPPRAPLASAPDAELGARLRAAIAEARKQAEARSGGKLRGADARVAVHVVDLERHAALADVGAGQSMRPASNMKLVTTAAALALAGRAAAFETRFELSGAVARGGLAGDLVVRAGGDPLLSEGGATDGRGAARLDQVAQALRARGILRISGAVVLDEASFPDPAPGPEWPAENQHWQDYCALSGGFSVNGGCLVATVRAARAGAPAQVEVEPGAHGLRDQWEVATAARGPLEIAFEARLGRVLVRGQIPTSVPVWSTACAHPDPVALFGHALLARLDANGIEVGGGFVRERGRPAGELLCVLASPVADCLEAINTHSANGVADQLFLATGLWDSGDASPNGAARATRRALERLGVSTEGLEQVDGSGLSRANRVTAAQMTALLAAVWAQGEATYAHFRATLAIAGGTGTLEERMRGGPAAGAVFAKTGFINGTSSLSGFVESPRGPLAFSILVEYPVYGGLNTSVWKPMQDQICELLAGGW